MAAPQPDQVAGEAVEVGHVAVAAVEPVPPDQPLGPLGVVRPQLVLEELLAHEQHRHAGRRQQQAGRHARAAAGVPGARVVPVGQLRDPRLAVVAVGVEDEVVVLDAVVGLPRERQVPRPLERRPEPAETTRAPAPPAASASASRTESRSRRRSRGRSPCPPAAAGRRASAARPSTRRSEPPRACRSATCP